MSYKNDVNTLEKLEEQQENVIKQDSEDIDKLQNQLNLITKKIEKPAKKKEKKTSSATGTVINDGDAHIKQLQKPSSSTPQSTHTPTSTIPAVKGNRAPI